jgi:hypothetical protein
MLIIFFVVTFGIHVQSSAQNQQLDRGLTEWAKKVDEENKKEALKEFERRMEGRPKSSQTISNIASGIHLGFLVLIAVVFVAGVFLAVKVIQDGISDKKNARNLLKTFKLKIEQVPESTPFATRRKIELLDKINNIFETGRAVDFSKGQYGTISVRTIKDFISHHDGKLKNVAVDETNYEKKIKILAKDFKKLNDLYTKATSAKQADDEEQFVLILKQIIAHGKPLFENTLAGIDIKENIQDLIERVEFNTNIQDIIYESGRGVGMFNLDVHLQNVFKQWRA